MKRRIDVDLSLPRRVVAAFTAQERAHVVCDDGTVFWLDDEAREWCEDVPVPGTIAGMRETAAPQQGAK